MGCVNGSPRENDDPAESKSDCAEDDGRVRKDTWLKANFNIGKVLGKGGSCQVKKINALDTSKKQFEKYGSEKLACKIMKKNEKVNIDLYKKELKILQMIGHKNIVALLDFWEDSQHYFIITKLCEGGELFDRIVDKKWKITEALAAEWILSLLSAIQHCHDLNIVHRDLKPENLLFESNKTEARMILIDFGCAKEVIDDMEYKDLVGTPYYLAPESAAGHKYVRTGKILKSSDLWSVGVITYVMMTGRPPFNGSSNTEIFSNIIKKQLKFPGGVSLSKPLQDFVKGLLKKSPKRRFEMSVAIKHPWVNGEASKDHLSSDVIKVLMQFQKQSKLKKAISKTLAKHMGEAPMQKIKSEFTSLDTDGNGKLDSVELSKLLADNGLNNPEQEAKDIINSVDMDGNGTIEFQEFATIWQRKLLSVNNAYIKAVFKVLDADGSGQIDRDELLNVLAPEDKALVDEIIKDVDGNNDGVINFEEFKLAMKETNKLGGGNAAIDGSDIQQADKYVDHEDIKSME